MHLLERGIDRLGSSALLGRAAQALHDLVGPLLEPQTVRTALTGSWVGHALHPAVMLAPAGAFLSAAVLDRAGDEAGQRAADRLQRLGLLTVPPTALTGLADWSFTSERARRVGVLHLLANVLVSGLTLGALVARARGDDQLARTQTRAAAALLGIAGYLGGHMSYVFGAGVSRNAFREPPGEWTRVAALDDLADGRPHRADADGYPVLLVAGAGRIHALSDRCAHLGCSLSEQAADFDGQALTCACHGSRYRLADGAVLSGPASTSQPVLDTRVREGVVEVRAPSRDRGGAGDAVVSLTDRLRDRGAGA